MATVRKRIWKNREGEQKCAWVVDFADQNGQRHREHLSTKRAADLRLAEVRIAVQSRSFTPEVSKLRVYETVFRYLERLEHRVFAGEIERASFVDVRGKLTNHVLHPEHGVGGMLLGDVGPGQAEEFYLELRRSGVSASTARRVLATLRAMLSWSVEQGYLPTNKLQGLQKKRAEREVSRISVPSHEQVRLLISQADIELSFWIRFAALTGLRASEQWALRWEHINLRRRELCVEQRVDRYGTIGAPKSRSGNRTIPLPVSLTAQLAERSLSLGGTGYVFPNKNGEVRNHANIMQRRFRPLCKGLGMALRWHDLRHYYVSCLIEAGLSPKAIQVRVGHANFQFTMDVYGHLFPSGDVGEELEFMASRISGEV